MNAIFRVVTRIQDQDDFSGNLTDGEFLRYNSSTDKFQLQSLATKADLVNGLVPSNQLPSYVDDIIEVTNYASLPVNGETGKIYVTLDTNLTYRWSGSAYIEITDKTAVWGQISGDIANQTDLISYVSGAVGAIDLSPYLTTSTAASTYLPLVGGTLTGDLKFTDATYDIGKSGATRPRDGFFSRNLTVGDALVVSSGFSGQSGFFNYSSGAAALMIGNSSRSPMLFWLNQTAAVLRTTGFEVPSGSYIGWQSGTYLYGISANTVEQRNSTNAQTFRLAETYTSSTSFGALQIKANAGAAYQIGSAVGSAGGTNRAITFGHWNAAGTFTNGIILSTSNLISICASGGGAYLNLSANNGGYSSITSHTAWRIMSSSSSSNSAIWTGDVNSGTASNIYFGTYDKASVDASLFGTGSVLQINTATGAIILAQAVATTGSPTALTITGAAHTTLTASTEATDVNFNLARTVQFAAGALTTQRAFRIQAPTYSFVGASTITTASTLSISGAPVAGANATITNAYALNVESGDSYFAGAIRLPSSSNGIYFSASGNSAGRLSMFGSEFYIDNAAAGGGFIFRVNSAVTSAITIPSTGIAEFHQGIRGTSQVLNVVSGTNAQTLRVYNTYTSATSGEYGELRWASSVLYVGSNKGSAGGSARDVAITHGGNVVANFLADRFYLGPIADSTATGGNVRGANSVDLIILRTAANQVVSGARSFGAGARCQVSGNDAYVIGNDSWGTGQYSMSFGTFCGSTNYAAVVIGINGVASGNQSLSLSMGNGGTASALKSFICGEGVSSATNSWATGFAVSANRQGMAAYAQGAFAANGDAQKVWWVLRRKTTDATPTTLMVDGSSTMLLVTSGKILVVDILISGIKSDGTAAATYKRKVAIKNVGGTTSLVGSVETIGTDYEDNYLTDVAITADNTNDALQINVTGITGETWRWVAVVEGLEIAYGT